MRLKVTLPRDDEHVPEDGRMPDGSGAPVWLGIGGPVVGEVTQWRDLGSGRAVVEMEVELPDWFSKGVIGTPDDLSFGLDAIGAQDGESGRIETYYEIIGVIVTADGQR